MTISVRILESTLRYRDGLQVHTAASGAVAGIRECYLHLERNGETAALGEVRLNIEFLTGIHEDTLLRSIIDAVASTDWSQPMDQLLAGLDERANEFDAPVRALLDLTLHDGLARASGEPLCTWLGATFTASSATNQCLFWCEEALFERRVQRYLDRGFTDLKLRMGVASFEQDLARLDRLRALAGRDATLSVDANGAWTFDQARQRLPLLAARNVVVVEQPVAADDWPGLNALATHSPLPLMVDEGLKSRHDIERVAQLSGALWAHLKLVKLGGIGPTLAAARQLQGAGVTLQCGQMNEGAAATAAAVHTAMVIDAEHRELYGADGIVNDPCRGVRYGGGRVAVPRLPGIGVTMDLSKAKLLWEKRFA